MTSGWIPVLSTGTAGVAVAMTAMGLVWVTENGVGEVVGFVDASPFTGVVIAGNGVWVVPAVVGFGWKQYFVTGAPVTERDTSQGSSLHWKKPLSPHSVIAADRSRHWQGLTQATVGCGVRVATVRERSTWTGAGVGVGVAVITPRTGLDWAKTGTAITRATTRIQNKTRTRIQIHRMVVDIFGGYIQFVKFTGEVCNPLSGTP
jgi:hypothetical protein